VDEQLPPTDGGIQNQWMSVADAYCCLKKGFNSKVIKKKPAPGKHNHLLCMQDLMNVTRDIKRQTEVK